MKIIVAPDSYKGSLSAAEAANAIERGVKRADPSAEVIKIPMADGGEGTVEAFVTAAGGRVIPCEVTGPLGNRIPSYYGLINNDSTAVIEMAAASGLTLVPEDRRDPLVATSYGTGELIGLAVVRGCQRIIVGIGGSATNDGGMGMAQALGVEFYDAQGRTIGMGCGGNLERIASINVANVHPAIARTEILVACDVTNPLTGPTGASAVYGPQKGATPDVVARLDRGLENLARAIKPLPGRGIDIRDMPGAGAAGGLGAALVAFFGARMAKGIDVMMEAADLAERMNGADLVITGEGRTDSQTAFGKVPAGIASLAFVNHIPVICLSGSLGMGFEAVYDMGITAAFSIIDRPMTLEEAMCDAARLLERSAYAVMKVFSAKGSRATLEQEL